MGVEGGRWRSDVVWGEGREAELVTTVLPVKILLFFYSNGCLQKVNSVILL